MALPLLSMGQGDHGMGGHSDEHEPSDKNIYMSTQFILIDFLTGRPNPVDPAEFGQSQYCYNSLANDPFLFLKGT